MKTTLIPTIALLTVFLCCNKTDAPPVNPCEDAESFKADFYIQESVGDSLVETDKVMQ